MLWATHGARPRPTERNVADELLERFLKGKKQAAPAPPTNFIGKKRRQRGFNGAGAASHQREAAQRQAAFGDFVEALDAGWGLGELGQRGDSVRKTLLHTEELYGAMMTWFGAVAYALGGAGRWQRGRLTAPSGAGQFFSCGVSCRSRSLAVIFASLNFFHEKNFPGRTGHCCPDYGL